MKKTLLIISSIIILIAIGVGVYFYIQNKKPNINVAPIGGTLPVAGDSTTTPTNNSDTTVDSGTNPDDIGAPNAVTQQLVEISAGPVVPGEIVLNPVEGNASSTATTTNGVLVKFIERQSGNVFSYGQKSQTLTRINNKTLPGIQSARWLPDGSSAFVQYLSGDDFSTVNTYSLSASSTEGFFLPQNLADFAISERNLLTLASGVNGSVASLGKLDGGGTATIFTTPLSSLHIAFAGKDQYLAFSKPSSSLFGDAFLVNSKGHFSKIAGPLYGLTALPSHSGKWALVSYTDQGVIRMELVDTTTTAGIALPVATIADKCVWTDDDSAIYCGVPQNTNPSNQFPDDWYQGAVHFSDKIWKINVAGRYAQLVLDFETANKGDLDATALAVDPNNTMLVFVNKNDGSLWGYSF